MKDSAVTKVCSDVCFILGIICFYRPLDVFIWPLVALVAACLIDGLLIRHIGNGLLRFLAALLPGLCILMCSTTMQYVAMGVALAYYLIFVAAGMKSMEIWTYRSVFIAMTCVMVFALVIALIGNFAGLGSVVFCLLFIVFGAITLRKMRMGASMSFKWNMKNAGTFAVPVLASILASVVVYFLLLGIWYLLNLIIVPNVGVAERPAYGTRMHKVQEALINQNAYVMEETEENDTEENKEPAKYTILDEFKRPYVLYIVIGVAAVGVFFLVYKYLHVGARDRKEEEYEETEVAEVSGKKRLSRKKKQRDASNAQKVRKIYREYLYYLSGKGVSLTTGSTTTDVLDESRAVSDSQSNDRLREIYLKARYGSSETVTPEEVAFARKMLEEIRENKAEQK